MFTGYIFMFLSHVFTYITIPFLSFLVFGIFPPAGNRGKGSIIYFCYRWSISWECEIEQLHLYSPTQDSLCNSSDCHPTQHRLPICPELSAFSRARPKK